MRQETHENKQLREFQTIDSVAQRCRETRHINTVTRVVPDESEGEQRSPGVTTTSAFGYKATRAGLVETQPSPLELHALITPPEGRVFAALHRQLGPAQVRSQGVHQHPVPLEGVEGGVQRRRIPSRQIGRGL